MRIVETLRTQIAQRVRTVRLKIESFKNGIHTIVPEYESPKLDPVSMPFAMTVVIGMNAGKKGKKGRPCLMIGGIDKCHYCGDPLSNRYGSKYCRNQFCNYRGLKQN